MDDKKAPRKQRYTTRWVFNRLQKEADGFDCSYWLVAGYVSAKKKGLNLVQKDAGHVPLIHYQGQAQCDFGNATFFKNSKEYKGKYLVLSFPYSNQGFHQLIYGKNMECLLESQNAIFRHIGGVPTEIWFDNTTTIVANIIKGGGRDVTARFMRFQEHYRFKSLFMNPESRWGKGSVENKVNYSRNIFLAPEPRFISLTDYNAYALDEDDEEREHYLYDSMIKKLFSVGLP